MTTTSKPDIQYFAEDGTWAKPAGAVRVDTLVRAASAGGAAIMNGVGADGEKGEIIARSFPADELPDEMQVTIGKGGRGSGFGAARGADGEDGYVIIVTHVRPVIASDARGYLGNGSLAILRTDAAHGGNGGAMVGGGGAGAGLARLASGTGGGRCR